MKFFKFQNTGLHKYYSDFGVQLRLFILLTVAFLISINFVAFYFFFLLKKEYNNKLNAQIIEVGDTFAKGLNDNILTTNRIFFSSKDLAYLQTMQNLQIFSNIQILDKKNEEIINFVNNYVPSQNFWAGLDEQKKKDILGGQKVFSGFYKNETNRIFRAYYIPLFRVSDKEPIVVKIESEQNFLGRLERLSPVLIGLRTVGIIAIVLITYSFIRTAIKPLRQLSEEVQSYRLATNAADVEEITGETDLRLALKTFREMVAELQEKEKFLQKLYDNAEQKAEKLQNYNDYILESISVGVISFDTDGKITGFNRAAEKIIGITEEDALNSSIYDIFGDNDEINKTIRHSLEHKREHKRSEIKFKNKLGEKLWISIRSSILKDHNGNAIGTTFLLSDLTEIKKLEEQINLKERLSALGEMAAGIAHEFRNSLAAIIGYTRLIKKQVSGDKAIEELLTSIMEESSAQERIVHQFLDFTRPTTLNTEEIEIHDLLDEVIGGVKSQIKNSDKYTFTKEYYKDNLKLFGDYTKLKQVFSNLVLNGIQAMPEGGELKISSDISEETKEQPANIRISISDCGVGIEEDDVSRIFTPFFTTKNQGTGLGLAIAHKIISRHNGTIEFISDGKNTIFTVSLPTVINP